MQCNGSYIRNKDDNVIAGAYHACKQRVQVLLRNMQNEWWMARALEVQTAADKRDPKSLFRGLKAIFGIGVKIVSNSREPT